MSSYYTDSSTGSYSTVKSSSSGLSNNASDPEMNNAAAVYDGGNVDNNLPQQDGDKNCFYLSIASVVFISICIIVVGSVIGLSYQYVEPLNYALMKNDNPGANKIMKKVFTNGRYFIGPKWKQINFPSTMIQVAFWKGSKNGYVVAFTDNGLEVVIEIVFYYRLKKDAIYEIFTKFNQGIYNYVVSNSLRALKNEAVKYSVDEWITRREFIQNNLLAALYTEMNNITFIEFNGLDFYVNSVTFPQQFSDTWLAAAVLTQNKLKIDADRVNAAVVSETAILRTQIDTNVTRIIYQRDQDISEIIASANRYAKDIRGLQTTQSVNIIIANATRYATDIRAVERDQKISEIMASANRYANNVRAAQRDQQIAQIISEANANATYTLAVLRDAVVSEIIENATSYANRIISVQKSKSIDAILNSLNITSPPDVERFVKIYTALSDQSLLSHIPESLRTTRVFGNLFGDKAYGGLYGDILPTNTKVILGNEADNALFTI